MLDESKLRDALAADPDGVAALLGGDAPQGIAARLDSVLDRFAGSTGALGGRVAAETARLGGYRASIDQAGVRLTQRESLLRAQFTAMERSLGQLRQTCSPAWAPSSTLLHNESGSYCSKAGKSASPIAAGSR